MQEIRLEVIHNHIPLDKEKSISALRRFLSMWYGVTPIENVVSFNYNLFDNDTSDRYRCHVEYMLYGIRVMEFYIKIIDQNGIESTMTYEGPQSFIKDIAGNMFDHLFR